MAGVSGSSPVSATLRGAAFFRARVILGLTGASAVEVSVVGPLAAFLGLGMVGKGVDRTKRVRGSDLCSGDGSNDPLGSGGSLSVHPRGASAGSLQAEERPTGRRLQG